MAIIQIDGVPYDVKCGITRTAEITASDISGMLMNGTLFNDVIGTYLQYDVRFSYPLYDQAKYAAIIDVLTEPVGYHTFIMPYDRTTVTITAKVETVSDELLEMENGTVYWRDLRFTITSIYPTKSPSLSGAIAAGMPPTPTVASPTDGDTYTWNATNGEWEEAEELPDADEMEF